MTDSQLTAYRCGCLFDGARWHDDAALLVADGRVAAIGAVPPGAEAIELGDGYIAPGFVDLQVNGGAGHLVGPATGPDDLATVCATHARFGVTALLPTLITDTDDVTDRVLAAGAAAARRQTPGFLGLHLEGPHLSVARKGAHEPRYIRALTETDIVRYQNARQALPHLLITVAAETVPPELIARLVAAGIVVSIGHSDASYEVAMAAFDAGASMATHLFNAMSQLGNRNPGLVGAALAHRRVRAGLIADGIHVHPATIRIALAAAENSGRIFLVSDSMSQAGTDLDSFTLNGRTIFRRDGALRLADGTLAGADLTLDRAVSTAATMGIAIGEALRMASTYPAEALGAPDIGLLSPGSRADFVWIRQTGVAGTWIGGRAIAAGAPA